MSTIILTHTPAEVLRQLLIDLGVAFKSNSYVDWSCFVSMEPDNVRTPDNIITIYDTQGQFDGRLQINGEIQEQYGNQIRVRAKAYNVGYKKATDIAQRLDQLVVANQVTVITPQATKTYTVHCAQRTSSVLPLGADPDNSERDLFTLNYLTSITEN